MVSGSDQGVLPSNQMGKDIGIIADICSHIQLLQEVPHFLCSNASENFVTQISCTYMIYNRGGGSGILRLLDIIISGFLLATEVPHSSSQFPLR